MTVIVPPTCPVPRRSRPSVRNVNARNEAPFDLSEQIYDWPGDQWLVDFTFAPMGKTDAAKWTAFLWSCEGIKGTFRYGLRGFGSRMATANGTVTIHSVQSDKAARITSPVRPKVGDLIQVGTRLHHITAWSVQNETQSNIEFSPRFISAPEAGDPVITQNPMGLWRLRDNTQGVDIDFERHTDVVIAAREAL